MALFSFRLPDIGEGISEAEIVAWHIAVGDRVEEDGRLADMMTDKATVEMESPAAGTVVELAGAPGDSVAIGATLVVIETDEEGVQAAEPERVAAENPGVDDVQDAVTDPADVPVGAERDQLAAAPVAPDQTPNVATDATGTPSRERAAVLASPAVRQRAKDLGIDLSSVKHDGPHVRHGDLDAYLRYGAGQGYHAPNASRARPDETVRVIGMRRRIAENMAAAKRHIPHFTYVDEIDVTALEAMRSDLNAVRGGRPKLTLLPLLIVAFCRALPDFPIMNARYDDEAGVVTRHGSVHMGMATQTDAGLMVPVIRDAQDRNVWQLATEITRLAEAARSGKATSAELSGGTITVTSLGPLGGIATTPVINRPEVAILGPNRIVERPVFRGDAIMRAKLMNLSISCDHRVVDGHDAASFVQAIRRLLETPVLLFAD